VSFSLTVLLWPKPALLAVGFVHSFVTFLLFKLCKTNLQKQIILFDKNLGVKINKKQKVAAVAGVSLFASQGFGCLIPLLFTFSFAGTYAQLIFRYNIEHCIPCTQIFIK